MKRQDVEFENFKSDLDGVFRYENITLIVEATDLAKVSGHLGKKMHLYNAADAKQEMFERYLRATFTEYKKDSERYHESSVKFRFIYLTPDVVSEDIKNKYRLPKYLSMHELQYFKTITDAVHLSARHEILDHLGLTHAEIGVNGRLERAAGGINKDYEAFLLHDADSGFGNRFRVVTFYIDPETLLRTSYVLRRDLKLDVNRFYQRMIDRRKIETIRKHLKDKRRVFVNNIIVTLPPEVTITQSKTDDPRFYLQFPDAAKTVCIIDGQHRVFAYYESDPDDPAIAALRSQQTLLVTGVISPQSASSTDRNRVEAELFLEINSNQTNVNSKLILAIKSQVSPYSTESIASRVWDRLKENGPLKGHIGDPFEKGKLEPSSIVKFGLAPLVKTSGTDSLFSIWDETSKRAWIDSPTIDLLESYVKHCHIHVVQILVVAKKAVGTDLWTTDRKVTSRVLTTVCVNAFLITLRLIIERQVPINDTLLSSYFIGFADFQYNEYKSSQYRRMADQIIKLRDSRTQTNASDGS